MTSVLRPTVVSVLMFLVLLGLETPCEGIPVDRFVFGFSNHGIPQTLTLDGVRTLSAIRQGWYDSGGSHEPFNDNYIAGAVEGHVDRNFFVFALPTRVTPITSATLNLFQPIKVGDSFGNGYSSPNPTETYRLFEVSAPPSAVGNVSFSPAIFDDLGSGTTFGSVLVAPSANGTTIHIPLNGAGVTALNLASGGEFALGEQST